MKAEMLLYTFYLLFFKNYSFLHSIFDDLDDDGKHELPHFQVMKLVRMRQRGLDEDFEGKTYSRVRKKT